MEKKIRVLLITDEVWNDEIHGNNVLTNWFDGFNVEFANIYCSPGRPLNRCCRQYFQVTDKMMLMSLIGGKKAGLAITVDEIQGKNTTSKIESEHKRLYACLKIITTEMIRALRELVWIYGNYDEDKLKKFIEQCNPDIIFCPRKASLKLLRLERLVKQMANKPMVGFTGDDEYSLRQLRFSPVYWLRQFKLRSNLRRNMDLYSLYYTHSEEQGEEYRNIFKIRTKTLLKCSLFPSNRITKVIHSPIKLVYAGKLYCNRWKTLAEITNALKKINQNEIKMVLEIYTKDKLTKQQKRLLHDGKNSFVKGAVTAEELKGIYNNSDIALHVESFDLKNKLLTKYSFSTKIIDCLASSCAVMAICWNNHTGYKYLDKENAAFCIDSYKKLLPMLENICNNRGLIKEYAGRAWDCGIRNHNKEEIQKGLYDDFNEIIEKSRLEK